MGVLNIFIFYFFLIFTTLLYASPEKPLHIVIDPGHGGSEDLGAQITHNGKTYFEKDLTLLMAQELKNTLSSKKFKVTLTRDEDKEIPLPERTALANRLKADVFISLHMNSSEKHAGHASGIETFILNYTTDERSVRLASLENKALKGSSAHSKKNEMSEDLSVSLIVKDLILDSNTHLNKTLACLVQSTLIQSKEQKHSSSKNRGVKEGLFYVLIGADMPSILVELGFIDHPKDRAWILDTQKRKKLSEAFSQALVHYKEIQSLQTPLSQKQKTLSTCQIH